MVLTFESVDDHSNERHSAVISCGAVQGGSNFSVCVRNPKV